LRSITGSEFSCKKGVDEGKGKEDEVLNMLTWAAGWSCSEKKDEAIKSRFRFLQVQGRMAPICSSAFFFSPSSKKNWA